MAELSISDVVGCGSCVGCGACGIATQGRVPIQLGATRTYQADLSGVSDEDLAIASTVCPFADESPDEDAVSEAVHPPALPHDVRTGRYLNGYAGRVRRDDITESSSGGLTSYLLTALLSGGHVDGVIHVGALPERDDHTEPIFAYMVSTSSEQIQERRKSQYYPVSADDVIRSIRGDGRRYAFVGIPCVITAMRHVMSADPVLHEQLAFMVGIVCGHLKSMAYAESFAWQLGIAPDELVGVDFRIKDPERTSREYGFEGRARDGRRAEAKTLSLVGGSWGHAVFQVGACDYCDDIFAETADVVFGDAWLARYEIDWRGTNMALTRNALIDSLLRDGAARGEIELDELTVDNIADTQGGNFRHRRQGLGVRLADDRAAGRWTPKKRFEQIDPDLTDERKALIRQRRELSQASHPAFADAIEAKDLDVYLDRVRPLIERYQASTAMSFATRVRNKLKRETWKLRGKVRARLSRRS